MGGKWSSVMILAGAILAVRAADGSPASPADPHPAALESPAFLIRYPADVSPSLAEEALRVLDEGARRLQRELGLVPSAPIEVLLLKPHDLRAAVRGSAGVVGAYDGRILVELDADDVGDDGWRRTLRHELTHALLRTSLRAALPPWLEEGVAESIEGVTPEQAEGWLRIRRAPPFAGLDALDADLRTGGWREDAAHRTARLALAALEECAGPGALERVIATVRSGMLPAAAIEGIVPGGRRAIEQRLVWLGRDLPSGGVPEKSPTDRAVDNPSHIR